MYGPPTHGPWHDWFAWRPINSYWYGWRWLCWVERRRWIGNGPNTGQGWDYRPRWCERHESDG